MRGERREARGESRGVREERGARRGERSEERGAKGRGYRVDYQSKDTGDETREAESKEREGALAALT